MSLSSSYIPLSETISDEELIRQYQITGNRDLVGELYQRYTHLVYGACLKYLDNKEESKDAVMSIFERLLHRLPDSTIESFNKWLYMVIKNECTSRLRTRIRETNKKETIKKIEKSDKKFMENEGYERLINKGEFNPTPEMLLKALNWLPWEQQTCVRLFYFKQKNYKEVAIETSLSLKQVKSNLQNGKRNLKKIIIEEYDRLAGD